MKRTISLLSVLLFTAVSLVFAGSFQWKKVSSEQYHFAVEMPDISEVNQSDLINTWSVASKSTGLGFSIVVGESRGAYSDDLKIAQENLDKAAEWTLKELNGKILNKRFFSYQGNPSVEARALVTTKGKKALVIERIILTKKESYVLFYTAAPSRYNPRDAEKYFDSLQIL